MTFLFCFHNACCCWVIQQNTNNISSFILQPYSPKTKYHQIQSYPISFFNTSHDHSFCPHNNNITHITSQNTIKTTNHNLMIIPLHHPISSFSNSSKFPFHIFKYTTITSIISWIDWRTVCEKRIHSFIWMWCSSTSINTPNWLKCLTLLMMCVVLNLSYLSTHHSFIHSFIHSFCWMSFISPKHHSFDWLWMNEWMWGMGIVNTTCLSISIQCVSTFLWFSFSNLYFHSNTILICHECLMITL